MKIETDRINAYDFAPLAMKALMQVEAQIADSGLEPQLVELVKLRASQINGCAFCIDLHSRTARRSGEVEQRLYLLNAWRESSAYSPRERAALTWTERLTLVAEHHVPDSLFEEVSSHFSAQELTELTVMIGQINTWNRLAIAFGYQHS